MSGLRILIADDQDLVRRGFRLILEAEEDIEVVADAKDGAQAVALAAEMRPDVVLLDIRMPVLDGLEAARRILQQPGQHARVLMLTTFDLDEYVYEALRVGASGFLLKDSSPEQLAAAVRAVAQGESILAPTVISRMIARFTRQPPARNAQRLLARLTPREQEVFVLLARGRSNQEIAGELFLGETTVKTHVARVLGKLGLRDRVQAVVLAYENGVVSPAD
ncbi:response regulator transcription factor [Ornithinimicrobium ciconiae]|uniref:Response regulator transcription factor n=1 Tax=Ornithinimicrobium ciconiae TaxID=2594265 RepID=A0A516GDH5_9MICO|nr:response regulator transcription factor [Ornithinimicrobium ciconiae]QDO89568.1 response regulator transcription factor [Ornithinimicrobium ciconiae]